MKNPKKDGFPKRPLQHIIDTEGTKTFEHFIPSEWDPPEWKKHREYGIDFEFEISSSEQDMWGDIIKGQLRSHWSVKVHKDAYISERIQYKHWNQWDRVPNPFYLIIADIDKKFNNLDYSSRKLYWINIKDHNIEVSFKKGIIIRIPSENNLTNKDSFNEFIQDAQNELGILRKRSESRPRKKIKKVLDDRGLGSILGLAISFFIAGLLIISVNEKLATFLLYLGALFGGIGLLRFSLVYKKTMIYNSKEVLISNVTYSRANYLIVISLIIIGFILLTIISGVI